MNAFFAVFFVVLTAFAAERAAASDDVMTGALPPSGIRVADGDQILFDVYREGSRVGFHRVGFKSADDGLVVDTEFQIEIAFLGIPVYRYRYDSQALWKNGALDSIQATVDDDGEISELHGRRVKKRFFVAAGPENYETSAPLFPTNHWNVAVVGQNRVLNTLTGRINKVQIQPHDPEQIETEAGPVLATRYAYTGELETEVWYDDAGRWVKMRFKGRDGSTLEYKCRLCLIGGVDKAS